MTRYVLDTDAVIDLFKGFQPTVQLIERLDQQGESMCLCSVVIAEVYAGLYPHEREQAQQLMDSMQVLLTSAEAARQAGLWRFGFARQGRQLTTTDCLIAATANEHHATLVTGNLNDFPMPEVTRLPLPRRQTESG